MSSRIEDITGPDAGVVSASQLNLASLTDSSNMSLTSLSIDRSRQSELDRVLPRIELREDPATAQRNQQFARVADELAQGNLTNNFFGLIRSEFSRGEGPAVEAAIARLNRSLQRNGVEAELRLAPLTAQQEQQARQRAQQDGRPEPQFMRHLSVVNPTNNEVLGGPFTLIMGRRPRQ